jgi:ABC-type uncharacterized transport system substrate-binding protein
MGSVLKYWLLILALTLSWAGNSRAADASVVLVSSDRGGAYQETTEALLSELQRRNVSESEVLQRSVLGWTVGPVLAPRLYIALGSDACEALARSDLKIPVLCTLLPQASFERIARDSSRRASSQFSALFLNQPQNRQIDLIRLALPQARRVGVLLGASAHSGLQASLAEVIAARGLTLVSRSVTAPESIFTGLKAILDESDILLAMADAQIYNSSSIQNILLASFRAQVPMLAFSPAYVRAGALLAVYSTPAQIGSQAADLAWGVLQGRPLPMPLPPREFSIMVNEHVARSLNLSLDAQALKEKLIRLEAGR